MVVETSLWACLPSRGGEAEFVVEDGCVDAKALILMEEKTLEDLCRVYMDLRIMGECAGDCNGGNVTEGEAGSSSRKSNMLSQPSCHTSTRCRLACTSMIHRMRHMSILPTKNAGRDCMETCRLLSPLDEVLLLSELLPSFALVSSFASISKCR